MYRESCVEVHNALLEEQDLIISKSQYCSLGSSLMDSLGLETGQQIRVVLKDSPEIYAIYTIAQARDEGGTILRMGLKGRRRLNESNPFEAYVSREVVHPRLATSEEARENNELVASLEDTVDHDLVISAPHGGLQEQYTHHQSTALGEHPLFSDYGHINVTMAQPDHCLGGYSPDNTVNRLASQELGGYGGIQIESSFLVREDFRNEVGDALAQALNEALNKEILKKE